MAVPSLEKQLSEIPLQYCRMTNGVTLAQTMKSEVDRLHKCIQKYIDQWYDSRDPTVYDRTYHLQGAIYADDLVDIRVEKQTIRICLRVHDALDYHENLDEIIWTHSYYDRDMLWQFGDDYVFPIKGSHLTSTLITMNYGWNAPKLRRYLKRDIWLLTKFEGIHFIELGIRDWKKNNKFGINIYFDDLKSRDLYR